jgi:hypothetical protein
MNQGGEEILEEDIRFIVRSIQGIPGDPEFFLLDPLASQGGLAGSGRSRNHDQGKSLGPAKPLDQIPSIKHPGFEQRDLELGVDEHKNPPKVDIGRKGYRL